MAGPLFKGYGYSYEGEPGPADEEAATRIAFALRRDAQVRGVRSLSRVVNLPSGTQVQATIADGLVRVHLVVPTSTSTTTTSTPQLTDFMSGWDTAEGIHLTPLTKTRVGVAQSTDPAPATRLVAVEAVHPTQFPGLMAPIVQAILGFGVPHRNKIFEAAMQAVNPTPTATQSNYAAAVKTAGVTVRYGYQHGHLHGAMKATDGTVWIVEFSIDGIFAMRLPYWPGTDDPRFLAKLTDAEAIAMIKKLGGFPSGAEFPSDPILRASMTRAGTLVQLASAAQVAPVYALTPLSSVLSWSMAATTGVAAIVVFDFHDQAEATPSMAYLWTAALSIVPGQLAQLTSNAAAAAVRSAFYAAYESPGAVPPEVDAALDKLIYLDPATVASITTALAAGGLNPAFELLDAITVAPVLGSAVLSSSLQGPFAYPSDFPLTSAVPTVFVVGDANISVQSWPLSVMPSVANTPLHVYFVGDEMRTATLAWAYDPNGTLGRSYYTISPPGSLLYTTTIPGTKPAQLALYAFNKPNGDGIGSFSYTQYSGVPKNAGLIAPAFSISGVDTRSAIYDISQGEISWNSTPILFGAQVEQPTDPDPGIIIFGYVGAKITATSTSSYSSDAGKYTALFIPRAARDAVLLGVMDAGLTGTVTGGWSLDAEAGPIDLNVFFIHGPELNPPIPWDGSTMVAYAEDPYGHGALPFSTGQIVDSAAAVAAFGGAPEHIPYANYTANGDTGPGYLTYAPTLEIYLDCPTLGKATKIITANSGASPTGPYWPDFFAGNVSFDLTWNTLGTGTSTVLKTNAPNPIPPDVAGVPYASGAPLSPAFNNNVPVFFGVLDADG